MKLELTISEELTVINGLKKERELMEYYIQSDTASPEYKDLAIKEIEIIDNLINLFNR